MLNRISTLCLAALTCAAPLTAQEGQNAPLSVIDWLDTQTAATPAALPVPSEPDVTETGHVPSITVAPLDSTAPKRVGLAPSNVTGLPDTLWSGTDGATLAQTIAGMPDLRLPALRGLYYTLLLAEAGPPSSAADRFDLSRVDALAAMGALDPALALLEQAGADRSPDHFARYMDMSLLAGTESTACAILRAQPHLSPGKAYDVFCTARAGDWNTAVLVLGTGRALGLIDTNVTDALERFLDPDLFEGAPPLPVPSVPDALSFRLFQAIGTPIPTRIWPVLYANADLADTAGLKARIEAAERLARKGAVPENRLLGLYTQRQPAASGSVWDRVAALQRFETALSTGSTSAISKTLPTVWREMQSSRLAVPFANLFAAELSELVLTGPTADIAFEVLLLSPQYETAPQVFPARAVRYPVLAAIASGTMPVGAQADGAAGAILRAFRDAPPDPAIVSMARRGALGQALLDALAITHVGGTGDVAQLTTGLATLRALGLEDVARRTAFQVLLLEGNA